MAQAVPDQSPVATPPRYAAVSPTVEQLAGLFPQFEVLELIGRGGMGTVYKARQVRLDRLVALKIIRPDSAGDPAFAERFHREARTLARLNHPGIVDIYDFGEVSPGMDTSDPSSTGEGSFAAMYYFVMEYVDGMNLRQLLDEGPLPAEQALAIVPQACAALQYAHEEGVVHRDIKPENILLDTRGRVKIADFGLAKLIARAESDFTLTATHQVMGTPRYMAPEQMEGSHAVDHRADIYSLGVVFYEMLTGQVPAGHFEPPSKQSDVDARLDEIVLRALARDPARRYQQVSEFNTDLSAVDRAAVARAPSPLPGPSTILDRAVAGVVDRVRRGWGAAGGSAAPEPTIMASDGRFGGRDWVVLSREQIEADDLPDVCIVCGQPAQERVNGTFSYQSEGAQILTMVGMFLFIFPGLIIEAYTRKEQRIACPVCPQHRNHWSRLHWWAGLGWLIPVLLGALGALLGWAFGPRAGDFALVGGFIGAVVGLIGYIVPMIWMATKRIDAEEITDTSVRLRRVSAAFAREASRSTVSPSRTAQTVPPPAR